MRFIDRIVAFFKRDIDLGVRAELMARGVTPIY